MGWLVEEVAADRSRIDAYLGRGKYDHWKHQKDEAKTLLASFSANYAKLPPKLQTYVAGLATLDADLVAKSTHDWGWGIEQIQAGRKVDKQQLWDIADIQDAALQTLEIENAVLESLLTAGLFAALMDFQYRNIEKAAADALPKVKRLQEELKKAEGKATEAKVQGAVNLGLTIATFFLPQLAVLTKVSIAVGQWAMDEALGGDKSTPTRQTVSDVGTYSSMGQPLAEEWLEAGGKTAAKRAGQALPVVGLYFDHDEIQATIARAGVIRAALNDAIESMKKVKALLNRQRPAMIRLATQMRAVGRGLKKAQERAAELRSDYRDLVQQKRYPVSASVAWRYEEATAGSPR